MAEEYIFFNRKSHTSEDIHGSSQPDHDTTHYFPWVYDIAAHTLGWHWWGLHLLEEWQDLPHLTAPPVYENKYSRLRGQERITWLAALRRVCAGAFEGAILQDFDGEDDYYPLAITLRNTYRGLKEDLLKAIVRGLRKLDAWLSWREQSPSEQLLIALSVIYLDAQNGNIVVPHPAPAVENGYFKTLLEEFRLRLIAEPPAENWLRILRSQFSALGKLRIPEAPVSVEELPSVFPTVQWLNISDLPVLPTSPEFWLDLKNALITRAEWANRATTLVGEALGLSKPKRKSTPVAEQPNHWQGIFRPGFTIKDLNNLLVSLGILDSADPIKPAYNAPPREWVAIAQALRETANKKPDISVLHRAFEATYGVEGIDVGNLRSFQRDAYKYNASSNALYEKALALIKGRY